MLLFICLLPSRHPLVPKKVFLYKLQGSFKARRSQSPSRSLKTPIHFNFLGTEEGSLARAC